MPDFSPIEPWLNFDGTKWVWLDGTTLPRVRGGSDTPPPPPAPPSTGFDPASGRFSVQDPPANQPPGGPANQPPAGPPPQGYYTEEQVRERLNQARTEERSKLYPQLDQERKELEELRAFRAEQERLRQEEATRKQQEAEDERRRKEEEEVDAKTLIARREAEIRSEMDNMRKHYDEEIARRDALLAKEREYVELARYREQALAANQENILPELADYVTGSSPQEIDDSVKRAIERTQSVLQNFRAVGQEALRQQPTASTRAPATDPTLMGNGRRELSPQDIAAMSMADYARYRDQLPPGRAGGSDRGLF